MNKKLEDLSIKIKELEDEVLELENNIKSIISRREDLIDDYYKASPEHVAITCTCCNGQGWVKKDDRKVVCEMCSGLGYYWGKLWK